MADLGSFCAFWSKPKYLLLIQKFVRGIKCRKCKIASGQIFWKAANLWHYLLLLSKLHYGSFWYSFWIILGTTPTELYFYLNFKMSRPSATLILFFFGSSLLFRKFWICFLWNNIIIVVSILYIYTHTNSSCVSQRILSFSQFSEKISYLNIPGGKF